MQDPIGKMPALNVIVTDMHQALTWVSIHSHAIGGVHVDDAVAVVRYVVDEGVVGLGEDELHEADLVGREEGGEGGGGAHEDPGAGLGGAFDAVGAGVDAGVEGFATASPAEGRGSGG